jgi:hypothetical protein
MMPPRFRDAKVVAGGDVVRDLASDALAIGGAVSGKFGGGRGLGLELFQNLDGAADAEERVAQLLLLLLQFLEPFAAFAHFLPKRFEPSSDDVLHVPFRFKVK